jgi:transglutaminase-like putative cysteine protease
MNGPDDARVYEVTHRTAYRYDDEVTGSYGRAHLTPREAPGQRLRSGRIEVTPHPELITERVDWFGNRCTYLEVHRPHTELVVTAVSVVEVSRAAADLATLDRWTVGQAALDWRGVGVAPEVVLDAVDFVLPSAQVEPGPQLRSYAAPVLPPERPLGEALADLVHRIHTDLAYVPGATSVTTSLPEVLARREGVCQDFAHLAVGCLRLAGLPARYVSGYLETEPPPGRPKLQGSDASHAWFSVLVPELGWVDLDPTNDQPADARYVVTAWGRDYTDIPPLKGVIFTESSHSTLSVGVDVVRRRPSGTPGWR